MNDVDVGAAVGEHYDDEIFDYESQRLEQNNPVELAMISRYLERWIEPDSDVADIGVGVGHYSELLARRGCRLHLVDVSENLLDATRRRLEDADLDDAVEEATVASATDLDFLDDESLDAILLLGPLYHLPQRDARHRCIEEAHRVLRPGGVVFATGINRLYYLRERFDGDPSEIADNADLFRDLMRDGIVDEKRPAPKLRQSLCRAHLTTCEDHRRLLAPLFDEVLMAGVESFTGHNQTNLYELDADARQTCLELVESTATTEAGRGASEHFLYVGRKE